MQISENGFYIRRATLDVDTVEKNENIQLWTINDNQQYLLCNLNHKNPERRLNISIGSGEDVRFFVKGQGTVHLVGYHKPNQPQDELVEEQR